MNEIVTSATQPPAQADGPAPAAIGELALLARAGRYADLETRTRQLLEQHPNAGMLWQWLGIALRTQGKDSLPALQRAIALLPDDAGAHNNLGNALGQSGRLEEAVASFQRALALNPEFAEAHNNLGYVLRRLGRLDDAASGYRRALQIKPGYAEAHHNLGDVLQRLGRLDDAVTSYQRALALSPDFAEAHNNLGNVLRSLGLLDDALASYRRALQLRPDFSAAHANLGIALRLAGEQDAAEASCRQALAIDPNFAASIATLAEISADQGRFAESELLFQRAIAIEPETAEAWVGISRLRKMTVDDAAWVAQAQRIAARPLPPQKQVQFRYAIGKYFDDTQQYEQAFENYRRANDLTRRYRSGYDRQQMTQAVDSIIRCYDREWLRRARGNVDASVRPVFIIGMPRSGTTLAEQILASHRSVFGAGELMFWNRAATGDRATAPGSPGSGEHAHTRAVAVLARDYLRLLERLSPGALRVVDKMPGNFLHLGLIHAALPRAHIIHMRRDPIDTCLSIYFQHFEAFHSYASDLDDLAHYYQQYRRLMAHWQAILPAQAMLDLSYEALVGDQEACSRGMLEFIGLPWDPQCMEFHRTSRRVISASKWQVRQRISSSSVGRWRNYQRFIEPLLRLTQP
jgi:tetratricopeptide (TPR) repeat protein